MDTATLARTISNGALLDTAPVPLVDLPPLDLPPLRTHARFMHEHQFEWWLTDQEFRLRNPDELRRFRRRERDRERTTHSAHLQESGRTHDEPG